MPVFKELYARVADGAETRRVIRTCGRSDYKQLLGKYLAVMGNSEMWRAVKATRELRPKEAARKDLNSAKGTGGRQSNYPYQSAESYRANNQRTAQEDALA